VFGKETDESPTLGGFVTSVPGAVGEVAKSLVQAVPRAVESIGETFAESATSETSEGGLFGEKRTGVAEFLTGESPAKSAGEMGAGAESFLESTGIELTPAERMFVPVIAAGTVFASGASDLLGFGAVKKGFTESLVKSADSKDVLSKLSGQFPELKTEMLESMSKQIARIDNAKGVESVIARNLQNFVLDNSINAAKGRSPNIDIVNVANITDSVLSNGGRLDNSGFVEVFGQGTREAISAAKKSNDFSKLSLSLKKAKALGDTTFTKVRVPVENIDLKLGGNKLALNSTDNVSFGAMKPSLQKSIDQSLGIKLTEEGKQDSFNFNAKMKELTAMGSKSTPKKAQAIKATQEALVNAVNKLPTSERGKLTTMIKNTQTTKGLQKALNRVSDIQSKVDVARQGAKKKNSVRSHLTYLRAVSELGQTAVSDAKKTLGIDKPISKMELSELQKLSAEMQTRLRYKQDKNLITEDIPLMANTDTIMESFRVAGEKNSFLSRTKKFASKTFDNFKTNGITDLATTAYSRLGREIADPVLRVYSDSSVQAGKMLQPLKVIGGKLKSMDKADAAELQGAMLNGYTDKVLSIAKKYGIEGEIKSLTESLESIRLSLESAGYKIPKRKDFFPRQLTDYDGLLGYLEKTGKDAKFKEVNPELAEYYQILGKELRDFGEKMGREATYDEITGIMNIRLRGYEPNNITLSLSGRDKKRTILQVTPEMSEFYENPFVALENYITDMTFKANAAKFFGKRDLTIDATEQAEGSELTGTIAAYIQKEINEGRMNRGQYESARELLGELFNPKHTGKLSNLFISASHLQTLNDLFNTMVQVGDIAGVMFESGTRSTLKSLFSKKDLKSTEMGIENLTESIKEKGFAKTLSDLSFKVNLFTAFERFNNDVQMKARVDSWKKAIEKPGSKEDLRFNENLKFAFGDSMDEVRDALRAYKGDGKDDPTVKTIVQSVALFQLMKKKPLTPVTKAVSWVKNPQLRWAYTLKSFAIQNLQNMFQETVTDIRIAKNPVEKAFAVQRGARLGAMMAGGYVAFDIVRDMVRSAITGEDYEVTEEVLTDSSIDALLGTFFLSQYAVDQLGRDPVDVFSNLIMPPQPLLWNVIENSVKKLNGDDISDKQVDKTIRNLPVIGEWYYLLTTDDAVRGGESESGDNLDLDLDLDLDLGSDLDLDLDLDLDI